MTKHLLNTTGERIAALLMSLDMTQKELAAQIGMSEQFLSAIMRGKSIMNVRHVTRIARALGTSVDYLTLVSDDPTPKGGDDGEQQRLSPQAQEIALLVDAMPEVKRLEVLDVVRAMAAHVNREGLQ